MNHSHENKVNIIEMSHRNDNEKIDVSKEGPLHKIIPEDFKINVEIQNKGEYIKDLIPENLIIAIDEFPYLIERDQSILSQFQIIFDEYLENKKIKIDESKKFNIELEALKNKNQTLTTEISYRDKQISILKDKVSESISKFDARG